MKKYSYAFRNGIYLVVLALLSLYGVYKNSIIPLTRGYNEYNVSIIIICSWVLPVLYHLLLNKENQILEDTLILKTVIYGLLLSPSTPLYLSIPGLFLVLIIHHLKKDASLEAILIPRLLISLAMFLLSKYTFLNTYEASVPAGYSILDLLAGKTSTCIGGSNTILLMLGAALLFQIPSYKKKIPFIAVITYIVLLVMHALISTTLKGEFIVFLQSSFLMDILLLGSFEYASPFSEKKQIIFAIFVSILSYILNQFIPYEGTIISVLLMYEINRILEK